MTNEEYLKHITQELSKPLPYKWKVQGYNKQKTKAMCVAFIDARIATNRLNEVLTLGWHREHFMLGTDIYCRLGVIMPDGSVIWRADAGESDNATERTKTAASDSFKRAAKEFGLGLFLYDLDIIHLDAKNDGSYTNVVRQDGSKIWDINKYINEELNKGVKAAPKKPDDSKPTQKKASTAKQQEVAKPKEESTSVDADKGKALVAIKGVFNKAGFSNEEVSAYFKAKYDKESLEEYVKSTELSTLRAQYTLLDTLNKSGKLVKA